MTSPTPKPLNEAIAVNDPSGHVQHHNDLAHYVNEAGDVMAGDTTGWTTAVAIAATTLSTTATTTSAHGDGAIAIGVNTIADPDKTTAVGWGAQAMSDKATAIGDEAAALNVSATAVGAQSDAGGQGAVAVGLAAAATGAYSTAVGQSANAVAAGSVAIGADNFPHAAYAPNVNEFVLGTTLHHVEVPGVFNLVPRTSAPTTPANGDMWVTSAGLFVRINGVTKTVTLT